MSNTLSIPQNPEQADREAENVWQMAEAVARLRKQQAHLRQNAERALAAGKHADADRFFAEAAKKEQMAAANLDWLRTSERLSCAEAERLVTLTDGVRAGVRASEKSARFAQMLHAVLPSPAQCQMLSAAIRQSGLDHAMEMLAAWQQESGHGE